MPSTTESSPMSPKTKNFTIRTKLTKSNTERSPLDIIRDSKIFQTINEAELNHIKNNNNTLHHHSSTKNFEEHNKKPLTSQCKLRRRYIYFLINN